MDNRENTFHYTYSAKEQTEVEAIRRKYLPQEESKLERLRRLDRSASQKAQAWALTFGILGVLLLGAGMSLFMSELGTMLNLAGNLAMLIGIVMGVTGMALAALAYPVYNRVLQKERQRIAPEILQLTEELMQ